jgi:NDP-sugar pyrophosphorylase family protein
MNLIIPMAGAGRRFREAGYDTPKPFIRIGGKLMIEWALEPIPPWWQIHPVALDEHRLLVQRFLPRPYTSRVTFLPGPTQGAACTVLAVALALPPEEPVAVMNADQWFQADLEALQEQALAERWDGYILTFRGEGERWSYVREVDGWVAEVREKQAISNRATVGFYWWRRAQDLVDACCILIAQNHRTKGEFYLAPAYNELIERYQAKVKAVEVEAFHGLGTPEDVQAFPGAPAPSALTETFREQEIRAPWVLP